MKYISLTLGLLLFANAAFAGLPPTTAKGQLDTSPITTFNFQTPNKLATKVVGGTLMENGNKNILANPSFEAVVNGPMTGWSWTGILTTSADSTVVIDGKQSQLLQPPNQALDFHADSTLYQAQFADGVQGLAYMRVKTTLSTTPLYVCPRKAGAYPSQMTSGCVQVQPTGKWGLYKVPFILGGTSNGIGITTNGVAVTDNIYVDDAFVGAVDLKVDSNPVGPWIDYGAMTIGAATTAPTKGTTTTDKVRCRTLGQDYECEYNYAQSVAGTAGSGEYIFSLPTGISMDGNRIAFTTATISNADTYTLHTSSLATVGIANTSTSRGDLRAYAYSATQFKVVASIAYTAVQAMGSSHYALNNANEAFKFTIKFPGAGLASNYSAYSTTNADYGFSPCTLTGSWVTNATYTALCKRSGEMLRVKGKVAVTGAPTAAALTLTIPNSLTIDANKIPAADKEILGHGGYVVSGANSYRAGAYYNSSTAVAIETLPASSAQNHVQAAVSNTSPFTFASGDYVSFDFEVPVSGWDNSNIIIGQFNGLESCANSAQCETTYYADISASAAVSGQEITFISGCTLSTNTFTCTYSTPFAQTPMCEITPGAGATQAQKTAESASSISYIIYNATGSPTNVAHSISCRKRGSDYVAKSARAVASDQNVATPGVTKVKACYYSFAGASGTVASPTECTTGTCVEVEDTCNAIAAPPRTSIGTYTVTISSGTFAPNALLNVDAKAYSTSAQIRECYNYNNSAQTWAANSSGGATLTLGCIGATGTSSDAFARLRIEGQAP